MTGALAAFESFLADSFFEPVASGQQKLFAVFLPLKKGGSVDELFNSLPDDVT